MYLLRMLLCLWPAGRAKNWLLSKLGSGWYVAPDAHFGPTITWRVRRLKMASGSNVGMLNVLRDLDRVELGEAAAIGQLNWFSGAVRWAEGSRSPDPGSLVMGAHATINARHYVDCSGGFRLADLARMAGVRSTVFTHMIDVQSGQMVARGVTVGERALLHTNVVLTPGCVVGDRCVVAAGAVVVGEILGPEAFFVGVPARRKSSLQGAALFENPTSRLTPPEVVAAAKQKAWGRPRGR